ncbi:MAG TPA: N-(5'-phosphoribosyl)anthranilate isomerase, partial [Candidatus Marinimicrobia bacterium]|nr:N-(5'-phosphoribosyl)anthranilate isomerase [Candidatus Neomarinimicrobiota bacterium]
MKRKVIEMTGVDVIQFHGDESPSYCASFGKRFIKRVKIQQEVDAEYVNSVMKTYSKASAVLLDPGAGDGRSFNWAGL